MLINEEIRLRREEKLSSGSGNLALRAGNTSNLNLNLKGLSNKLKKKKERAALREAKKGLVCSFCNIKDSYIEENYQKKHLDKKGKRKDSEKDKGENKAYSAIFNKSTSSIYDSELQIIDSRAT